MSTIQATNLKHNASVSNNIVLDASGNATFAGTAAMSSSFLRNRIINGDMRIDQRNAGASVVLDAGTVFPVDRFRGFEDSDGAMTGQRSTTAPAGFINSLQITTTTADASLGATQYCAVEQIIEGSNISDLGWGTASAQTVTLSFWVRSSLTGTFGGTVKNSGGTRSYPYTYTISAANTWEFKTVTVPGDTIGTWATDNGQGIRVQFGLGVGSSFSGTAGAWSGTNSISVTGAVSVIGTLNATWLVTGVQLEVGSAATPFERRQFGQELALCQRYYESAYNIWSGYTNGASPYYLITTYKVTKRAAASISLLNTNNSGFPNTAATVGVNTEQFFRVDPISNASSTAAFYQFNWVASAEL